MTMLTGRPAARAARSSRRLSVNGTAGSSRPWIRKSGSADPADARVRRQSGRGVGAYRRERRPRAVDRAGSRLSTRRRPGPSTSSALARANCAIGGLVDGRWPADAVEPVRAGQRVAEQLHRRRVAAEREHAPTSRRSTAGFAAARSAGPPPGSRRALATGRWPDLPRSAPIAAGTDRGVVGPQTQHRQSLHRRHRDRPAGLAPATRPPRGAGDRPCLEARARGRGRGPGRVRGPAVLLVEIDRDRAPRATAGEGTDGDLARDRRERTPRPSDRNSARNGTEISTVQPEVRAGSERTSATTSQTARATLLLMIHASDQAPAVEEVHLGRDLGSEPDLLQQGLQGQDWTSSRAACRRAPRGLPAG